ncbi:hypothetical protein C8R44DRAFT_753545 [Mycena epipterygia]|nr:hypothetical protein C8R44DRAFT_753545 [Mycena epipterygia]
MSEATKEAATTTVPNSHEILESFLVNHSGDLRSTLLHAIRRSPEAIELTKAANSPLTMTIPKHTTVFPAMRNVKKVFVAPDDLETFGPINDIVACAKTETFLRTHHPALRDVEEVRVFQNPDLEHDQVWVLRAQDAHPLYLLKIGGRPVQFLPDNIDGWTGHCASTRKFDPYFAYLHHGEHPQMHGPFNPRAPLPQDALKAIASCFPGAIGLRIYTFGIMGVLYPDVLPSNAYLAEHTWPSTIAGMRYMPMAMVHVPTSHAIARSSAIDHPPKKAGWISDACLNGTGIPLDGACIGLHLRLSSGEEVLTTATHGYVPPPYFRSHSNVGGWVDVGSRLMRRISARCRNAVDGLWKFAQGWLGGLTYTAVGTRVYMRLSAVCPRLQFGVVTKMFDEPSALVAYPFGYRHDLSLISAEDGHTFPKLLWWSDMPQLRRFTSFNDVLADPRSELFCVAPHLCETGPSTPPPDEDVSEWQSTHPASFKLGTYQGSPIPQYESELLICAREYTWESDVIREALLWRCPGVDLAGASGAANFQSPDFLDVMAYKGGFQLPKELDDAEILPGLRYNHIPVSLSNP